MSEHGEADDHRSSLPPIDFTQSVEQAPLKVPSEKVDPPPADSTTGDAAPAEGAHATATPRWVKIALPALLLAVLGLAVVLFLNLGEIRDLERSVSSWRSEARRLASDNETLTDQVDDLRGDVASWESRAKQAENDLGEVLSHPIGTDDIVGARLDGASLTVELNQSACEGWSDCDEASWTSTSLEMQFSCDGADCTADDLNDVWWLGTLDLQRTGGTWAGSTDSARNAFCNGVRLPQSDISVSVDFTIGSVFPQAGGGTKPAEVDLSLRFQTVPGDCRGADIVLET